MTCLNDTHIQALADGEGTLEMGRHVDACVACAAKLRAREALMEQVRTSVAPPVHVPAALGSRVESVFRESAHPRTPGATRLVGANETNSGFQQETRQRWVYGGLGVAAATVLAVLFVAPAVRRPDATLSAAEILAKSASRLSASAASGVELLEYELVLSGVPKEMIPDGADGTYHVRQAIDHSISGRFRFSSFAPDGRLLSSVAQDPAANRRVMAFSVDGQPYRFEVSLPSNNTGLSLPEMERLHMEASITMMQASGNQIVQTIDRPSGKQYRIEVPRVSGPGTSPVWDLTEARVVIDAADYRVTEFAVSGSFLKQAYSLSYTLIGHSVVGSVPADTFAVPRQPGEIVISGEGSHVPSHDVVMLSLRELTKLKQGQ